MSKNGLNPRNIIKILCAEGDGQTGESKGQKQERYLKQLLEGKNKQEQIAMLRELFPNHSIWSEMEPTVEPIPIK